MKKLFLLFVFLGLQVLNATPPPVEQFFQNPTFRSFKISPNGEYIAGLIPYNGYMNVAVINLESKESRILTGQEMDVTWFTWVNNSRLLYSVNQGEATSDAQNNAGAIFGVDLDGKNHGAILDSLMERKHTPGEKHRGWINVLNKLENDPDHVLVTNNSRRSNYPDLYQMNVHTGRLRKVSNNPGYITGYFTGPDGEVLGGVSWENPKDATTASILRRDPDTDKWETMMELESIYEVPQFVGTLAGSEDLLVSKKGQDGMKRLYRMSFEGGFSEEIILEDPVYDITGVTPLRHLKTDEIIGVHFNKAKPVNHFFNNTYKALYNMIDDAIPGASNYVFDYDKSGAKLLVLSTSDKASPEYFLLDIKQGTMDSLGKMFPNLSKVYLPECKPISYNARDGHPIHGYLFLPENFDPNNPIPMIINPHGGPWSRDTWGVNWWLDIEPAFLVSRGFAVLKVNFRASTGYGSKHEKAADRNWDVTMEDIWDGVNWAISEGIADKDRIGVMGASFGGTATMLSLVHQPEMFQFGVNFFGVVDIPEQIRTYYEWDRDIAGDSWKKRAGDPKKKEDKVNLHRWSAINHVENIDDPLFIYHGLVDRLVDIEQSRALVKRLKSVGKKKGRDYTVVWNTDEGHGAYNAERRIELYKKVDDFLKPFSPAYGN